MEDDILENRKRSESFEDAYKEGIDQLEENNISYIFIRPRIEKKLGRRLTQNEKNIVSFRMFKMIIKSILNEEKGPVNDIYKDLEQYFGRELTEKEYKIVNCILIKN